MHQEGASLAACCLCGCAFEVADVPPSCFVFFIPGGGGGHPT